MAADTNTLEPKPTTATATTIVPESKLQPDAPLTSATAPASSTTLNMNSTSASTLSSTSDSSTPLRNLPEYRKRQNSTIDEPAVTDVGPSKKIKTDGRAATRAQEPVHSASQLKNGSESTPDGEAVEIESDDGPGGQEDRAAVTANTCGITVEDITVESTTAESTTIEDTTVESTTTTTATVNDASITPVTTTTNNHNGSIDTSTTAPTSNNNENDDDDDDDDDKNIVYFTPPHIDTYYINIPIASPPRPFHRRRRNRQRYATFYIDIPPPAVPPTPIRVDLRTLSPYEPDEGACLVPEFFGEAGWCW